MVERPDDYTVTEWALAAGRGDRTALAAFVRATQRDVLRFVTHLNGPADAEDLAQETYLRALGSLPTFTGRSGARAWLLSVARHTCADAVRTARRHPRPSPVADWDAPGQSPGAPARPGAEDAVVLRALIAGLDPPRREAFVLTQVLGLRYAEAAQICECPIGTIRSRVARAREDLVTAMADRTSSSRATAER
jgi:RNA polymerase sigma-70 factor (ECF subfamily)